MTFLLEISCHLKNIVCNIANVILYSTLHAGNHFDVWVIYLPLFSLKYASHKKNKTL